MIIARYNTKDNAQQCQYMRLVYSALEKSPESKK